MDVVSARWARPWTNVGLGILHVGIALGSWWAYYELGWGGWWFWDPVENASFMPWLVGTALIHSQAVTEKRGGFRAWTLLLSIVGIFVGLLGTFLVRSGVLIQRALLAPAIRSAACSSWRFLGASWAAAVADLCTARAESRRRQTFKLLSRETLLLTNNICLFTCAAAMVLLGTLYPLIGDAIGVGTHFSRPAVFRISCSCR